MSSTTQPANILIIGAGVLALSTATLLQQKHPNATITLIAAEFPSQSPILQSSSDNVPSTPSYASMWAGAHYRPIPFIPSTHSAFSTLDAKTQAFHRQLARERDWAVRTASRMMELARSRPEAGVQIVDGEEVLEDPPVQNLILRSGDVYACKGDRFRVWSESELEDVNKRLGRASGKVTWGASYRTYVVNPHIYTGYLLDEFRKRGGRTVQRRLHKLTDALDCLQRRRDHSYSERQRTVIVNCTGTGLVSDPNTMVIRGQTILVRKTYHKTITRQCQDGTWSFLIPRPLGGGTIIGGTKQVGDMDAKPRPEERKKLLENAARYFPGFIRDDVREEEIVCDNVGFRPWRDGGVRVEKEEVETEDGNTTSIVHGYGAGGRGYEISWGVAEEVSELVGTCLDAQSERPLSSRL